MCEDYRIRKVVFDTNDRSFTDERTNPYHEPNFVIRYVVQVRGGHLLAYGQDVQEDSPGCKVASLLKAQRQ